MTLRTWSLIRLSTKRACRLHWLVSKTTHCMSVFHPRPLPTHVSDSYVIPRHLRQTETIHPPSPDTPELGTFRGEPVYPRSSVVSLKTAETWMRTEGRTIQEGAHPLKMVKMRTGTIAKQRELEMLRDGLREAGEAAGLNGEQQVMQGLYARSQTEPYVPPPVIDVSPLERGSMGISLILPLGCHSKKRLWKHRLVRPIDVASRFGARAMYVCLYMLLRIRQ